ncbi:MAG: hypothetical protein PVI33_06480, partial [Candidatus Omnitrophota bacterium]
MDKYYYLIASLPLLKFTEAPFLSGTSFITEAKKWLSPDDFAILSKVDINNFLIDEKDTPLLRKWKEFEYSNRSELAF